MGDEVATVDGDDDDDDDDGIGATPLVGGDGEEIGSGDGEAAGSVTSDGVIVAAGVTTLLGATLTCGVEADGITATATDESSATFGEEIGIDGGTFDGIGLVGNDEISCGGVATSLTGAAVVIVIWTGTTVVATDGDGDTGTTASIGADTTIPDDDDPDGDDRTALDDGDDDAAANTMESCNIALDCWGSEGVEAMDQNTYQQQQVQKQLKRVINELLVKLNQRDADDAILQQHVQLYV
jgi:hypothetical protein